MTTYFRGNLNVASGIITKVELPNFILTGTAGSVVASGAIVNFPFSVVTSNAYNIAGAAPVSTVTIPAAYAGKWLFIFSMTVSAGTTGDRLYSILVNGTEVASSVGQFNATRASMSRIIDIVGGDIIACRVFQTNGTNLTFGGNTMSNFEGIRISN